MTGWFRNMLWVCSEPRYSIVLYKAVVIRVTLRDAIVTYVFKKSIIKTHTAY